jgi:DNA polymerase III, alpha subunit (gram-positive type)
VRDENSKKIDEKFDEVFSPEKSELTKFVSFLTGISATEISGAPQISEQKNLILEKIGDAAIVGHNIDFDLNCKISRILFL